MNGEGRVLGEDDRLDDILRLFPPMNPGQVAALRWIVDAATSPPALAPRLLTVPEVAERIAFSRDAVWRLIRSGRLRAVRTQRGSPWRVREDYLRDFIDALDSNDVDWRAGRRGRR
jgi:excisionase family DNA binding protein